MFANHNWLSYRRRTARRVKESFILDMAVKIIGHVHFTIPV